jgi:hypothetical protein
MPIPKNKIQLKMKAKKNIGKGEMKARIPVMIGRFFTGKPPLLYTSDGSIAHWS